MMWLYVVIAVVAVLLVADIVTLVEIAKVSKKMKNAQASKQEAKTEPKQEKKEAPKAKTQTNIPAVTAGDEKEILTTNDRFNDKEEVKEIKEEKKEEPQEKAEEKKEVAAVEEETEPKAEEKVEEKKPEPKEEKPVEKKAEEPKEAPKKEVKEKTPVKEKKEEPAKEQPKEKAPAKAKKEEAPKKESKEKAPAKEKKEAPAKKAPVKEEPIAPVPAKEPAKEEKKEKAKVAGKIEICNSDLGGFSYILRANNGQLLYESKTYKSVASCIDGANSFVEAVKVGMFRIRADKFNRYKFILKSPTSNNIIYVGESFDNERSCQSNIESVRRFAEASEIVDITEADFKAKFVPYVISDEVKEKVKNNNGVVGKWAIEQVDEENKKNSPYVFLLYASNGQLLYESRDYSSYNSCKNGLETFRKAVSEGQFIIDPDKSGRFKFILRNVNKNSLMEYIGQNYSSERACAEGIDSIYRFALVSPTDKL